MLIKAAIAAAILATSVGAGTVAIHKFADLQRADDALLTLANPDAIASPTAPAKLAQVGGSLQKVAGVTPPTKPQGSRWVNVAEWHQQ